MTAEQELEKRCLPQLIPTYASKHSLVDYYDMVPVCQNCAKAYIHLDKVRTGEEEPVEELPPEPPKSPLLGTLAPDSPNEAQDIEQEVDGTAAGIRERLMEMYSMAAKAPPKDEKKIILNTAPLKEGSTEVSRLLKMSRIKKEGKTDDDYERMFPLPSHGHGIKALKARSKSSMSGPKHGRLPNIKKYEAMDFPRSKTSMGADIAKASRALGRTH
jgi:hypothetical protein